MMYVDTDPVKWAKKYGLQNQKVTCKRCGVAFQYIRPFVITGFAGLATPEHECGKNYEAIIMTPTSQKEIEFWKEIMV